MVIQTCSCGLDIHFVMGSYVSALSVYVASDKRQPGNVPIWSNVDIVRCRSTTESHVFVWNLLGVISSEERLDLRRYFRRAIQFWARGNKLTPSLVTAVCSHTTSKEHLQVRVEDIALLVFEHSSLSPPGSLDDTSRDFPVHYNHRN